MTERTPQGPLRIGDAVVFRELDGEAVLLNLDSGLYFGLDPVGTRIWQLIAEHGRSDAVLDHLIREYDESEDVLKRDLDRLIASLVEKGLLAHDQSPS